MNEEDNTGTEFICYLADSLEGADETIRDMMRTPDEEEEKEEVESKTAPAKSEIKRGN